MAGIEGERADIARRPRRPAAPRRRSDGTEAAQDGMAVALGCALPEGREGVALPGPEALDAVLLATLGAKRVFCPLVAGGFDALSVALRLSQLDFGGTLVVLAPVLPNPKMVEREIRNQSGGVQVQVVTRGA